MSKKWEWLGDWNGLDTPKTIMTTRASAVLINDISRWGRLGRGGEGGSGEVSRGNQAA